MFGATATPYDLRFQALGIPVRVHPMFWLVAAMLGWENENIPVVLVWIGCVFLSILVHEYGHGLMAKRYGASPSILLSFGGLCSYSAERQTPGQRLAVLLWGPGAGFALCLATMVAFSLARGITPAEHFAFVKLLLISYFPFLHENLGMNLDAQTLLAGLSKVSFNPLGPGEGDPNSFQPLYLIYRFLLEINIMWGILNLLPIWPLDGGQVSQTVLSQISPYQGRRWAHVISLLVAAGCAFFTYTQSHSLFNTFFFAYFAIINYQILDSIHRAQSLGIYEDDPGR